jgi:hypothetical protein
MKKYYPLFKKIFIALGVCLLIFFIVEIIRLSKEEISLKDEVQTLKKEVQMLEAR